MRILICFLFFAIQARAQFAPQVGIWGSAAIHKSSPSIKSWANTCLLQRGFVSIADKSLGWTTTGDFKSALGVADGNVVSLGDSGIAIVQFAQAVYNGIGPDFAVFENGFQNPSNTEEAYLELAFVEVSSDGVQFFRFPSTSNTLSMVQVAGTGDYMNARLINNLAGKYIAHYGTAFDLEDLKGTVGLDLNHISHIRIVDVIGDVGQYGTKDFNGQRINDPYPTAFATGGFDLDAIAAINIQPTEINELQNSTVSIFPNPTTEFLTINFKEVAAEKSDLWITDVSGKTLLTFNPEIKNRLDVSRLMAGLYFINIRIGVVVKCIGKFSKI